MRLRFRQAAVTLALAAMVLRALLPMGWMPNPSGFAISPLIICLMDMPSGMTRAHAMDMSGTDMMDMSGTNMDVHDHRGGGHDHGGSQSNETCPFAAAPHVAAPATVAALTPSSTLSRFVVHEAPDRFIASIARYQPQSPRAPPKIA